MEDTLGKVLDNLIDNLADDEPKQASDQHTPSPSTVALVENLSLSKCMRLVRRIGRSDIADVPGLDTIYICTSCWKLSCDHIHSVIYYAKDQPSVKQIWQTTDLASFVREKVTMELAFGILN